MPTQEDENKTKAEKEQGLETPEEAAVRKAARAAGVAQAEKETFAAAALAGAETEMPVAEHAEKDQEARAREIAEKYLKTIPAEDRKFTDPKQVEKLLWVLLSTIDPRDSVFSPADKYGNPPERVMSAIYNEAGVDFQGAAKGWREFAADPVGIARETDKVRSIAKSSLPESVRTAILSIILKEGDYSTVDMANNIAEIMEHGKEADTSQIREKYYVSADGIKDNVLRQKATLELFNGLYPELMQSDGVKLFLDIKKMPFEQHKNREAVVAMVERYNQVFGGETVFGKTVFAKQKIGGASNGIELLARLKDGSIMDDDVREVLSLLDRAIRVDIAKKATSAEAK